ncbi:terminase small subunit [Paenibacillus frigoriresistens]|uniref:terminase small subunit n=1 Tax=Paenibacillus alginolyticus TaxID=59839 RepID=UPI001565854C|nr:terminase small subunit [Paenibacillus frigoriresistens]NRF90911.1 terminase small subunit [Paenibacillus frigoriresistens]
MDAWYKATTRSVADGNARKLMLKPAIKAYLDQSIAEKDAERIAMQDEILIFLTNVTHGKVQEQLPLGMGMGEQSLVKKESDGAARIKAAEILGKGYAIWTCRK